MPNHRRSEVAAWIPAAFCFVVSYIPLVLNPTGIASPAFLAFLPMCFLFVGSHLVALQRRIGARSDFSDLYAVCDAAARWFQQQLATAPRAQQYLARRGVDAEIRQRQAGEREEERGGDDDDQQRAQAVVDGRLARRPARTHPHDIGNGADEPERVAQEGDLERGVACAQ